MKNHHIGFFDTSANIFDKFSDEYKPAYDVHMDKVIHDISDEEDDTKDKHESSLYCTSTTFKDMHISRPILRACTEAEFIYPTKVQQKVIPIVMKGKDVFVNAETGSGKTACYLLPIIESILEGKAIDKPVKAIILVPARELVQQTVEVATKLLKHCSLISVFGIIGGISDVEQKKALTSGADIIVATPGRLFDLILNENSINVLAYNVIVLDEADKLLELGFKDSILELISYCAKENRQTLLFSATLNPKVIDLEKNALRDPFKVKINPVSTVENLSHKLVRMAFKEDPSKVFEQRMSYLVNLLNSKKGRTIVFFNTKEDCKRARIMLQEFDISASELHGDVRQNEREEALKNFATGEKRILCATDLAGRGVDVEKVALVVNFEMPLEPARYIHRVGRTARKGYTGDAITICNEEDREKLKKMAKKEKFAVESLKLDLKPLKKVFKKVLVKAGDVDEQVEAGEVDRELEKAEKSVTKAINMEKYRDEIFNKPKKTCFLSKKKKRDLNQKSKEEMEKY